MIDVKHQVIISDEQFNTLKDMADLRDKFEELILPLIQSKDVKDDTPVILESDDVCRLLADSFCLLTFEIKQSEKRDSCANCLCKGCDERDNCPDLEGCDACNLEEHDLYKFECGHREGVF